MVYKGQLAYHTEQGCGGWIQFHDDRGLHGDENQYWNWDWTINFCKDTKLENIQIFNMKDEELYNGPWTSQRGKPNPLEIKKEDIMLWAFGKAKVIITTDEILDGYAEWADAQAEKILLEKE